MNNKPIPTTLQWTFIFCKHIYFNFFWYIILPKLIERFYSNLYNLIKQIKLILSRWWFKKSFLNLVTFIPAGFKFIQIAADQYAQLLFQSLARRNLNLIVGNFEIFAILSWSFLKQINHLAWIHPWEDWGNLIRFSAWVER